MDSQGTAILKPGSTVMAHRVMPHDRENETLYTTKKDAFQVDTSMIPQATLEDQGSLELEELGLNVFNQDVFEEGDFLLAVHFLCKIAFIIECCKTYDTFSCYVKT